MDGRSCQKRRRAMSDTGILGRYSELVMLLKHQHPWEGWKHSEVLQANGILTFNEFAAIFWPDFRLYVYSPEVHHTYEVYLGLAIFDCLKNGGPKMPPQRKD